MLFAILMIHRHGSIIESTDLITIEIVVERIRPTNIDNGVEGTIDKWRIEFTLKFLFNIIMNSKYLHINFYSA